MKREPTATVWLNSFQPKPLTTLRRSSTVERADVIDSWSSPLRGTMLVIGAGNLPRAESYLPAGSTVVSRRTLALMAAGREGAARSPWAPLRYRLLRRRTSEPAEGGLPFSRAHRGTPDAAAEVCSGPMREARRRGRPGASAVVLSP